MRALLVDDHPMFCQSLGFLLEDLDPTLECISATSIARAVAEPGPFNLILLDYAMPDVQGDEGLVRMLQAHAGVPVMMLSGDPSPTRVRELIERGAAGYVSKAAEPPVLLEAIGVMLAGGVYVPEFALHNTPKPPAPTAPLGLTGRQLDCLLKLAHGKSNKVIARELNLAENTVKSHLANAFRVLGVANRTEAVYKAAALRLVPSAEGSGEIAA